jgi:hypothetical protein
MEAHELMKNRDIGNISGFLDKLILKTLGDDAWEKKKALREFNDAIKNMERAGFFVHIESISERHDNS